MAPPSAKAAQRERTKFFLNEARAKVGTLRLRLDVPGGLVAIDGKAIAAEELANELFLKPGKHLIEAKREGYKDAQSTIEAKAGGVQDVALTLEPLPAERRSVVPGAILAGVGVAALATGIGLMGDAKGKYASSGNLSDSIRSAGHSCITGAPNFDTRCDELFSTGSAANTNNRAGIGLLVGGGALGAAAVTYFLWPSSSKTADAGASQRLVPVVSTGGAGLIWSGAF
jgi:hypothetical protein